MFQQYFTKASIWLLPLCHLDDIFCRIPGFLTQQLTVLASCTFHIFSWKWRRNNDVIKQIFGKEHMPNKLHKKSSQFTNEFIGNFRRRLAELLTTNRHQPICDTTNNILSRHLFDTFKTQYLKDLPQIVTSIKK